MLFIGLVMAFVTFLFFTNKQYNRNIDRRNRFAEKQEELIEMLREKNNKENKEENEN